VGFPGCEAYRSQLIGLKVAHDNGDGLTLFMHPDDKAPSAPMDQSGLTLGEYEDSDGTTISMSLVAGHGRLRFLDILKFAPAEPLLLFPPNEKIEVRVAPPALSSNGPRRTAKIRTRK
jgi:hypothetical protein